MPANTAKNRIALIEACQSRAEIIRNELRALDGALLSRSVDPTEGDAGEVFERWLISERDYPTRATLLILHMRPDGWDIYAPLVRTNSTADTVAALQRLITQESDSRALDDICAIMDGNEWDSDTTAEIARIVAATGRPIGDPS